MTPTLPRKPLPFAWLLAALTALGLLVRVWGLASQPPLADDRVAGTSAIELIERGQVNPLMRHHPRVRDAFVYAGISALGPTKLGLVLPSLLLGVLSVPLLGLLGRRLASPAAGLVAAALLAVDSLHVLYSREAVQDGYTFFFATAGVLLALRWDSTRRAKWLVASGIIFGLGTAAKWSVAFPLVVVAAWLALRELRARDVPRKVALTRLAFTAAALAVLPAAIYLATWTPWFLQGRTLVDWLALQAAMAREAASHAGAQEFTIALPHQAWMWFVWPTAWTDFTVGPAGMVVLLAITNPVVWCATLPSIAWLARRASRERRPEDVLLLLLFAGTYLPFLLVSRPVWVLAALPLLPFALVAIAMAAAQVARAGVRGRAALMAYGLLVILGAVPLLALATGYGMDLPFLEKIAEAYRPEARFEGIPTDGPPAP